MHTSLAYGTLGFSNTASHTGTTYRYMRHDTRRIRGHQRPGRTTRMLVKTLRPNGLLAREVDIASFAEGFIYWTYSRRVLRGHQRPGRTTRMLVKTLRPNGLVASREVDIASFAEGFIYWTYSLRGLKPARGSGRN